MSTTISKMVLRGASSGRPSSLRLLRQAARPFTSARAWEKETPSISNIDPHHPEAFQNKQKRFREGLAKSKSQSLSSSESTGGKVLGSFAPSNAEDGESRSDPAAAAAAEGKKGGALQSLIYGTEAGRKMDQELEKSFSQMLARGKYVHSIVFHDVKPDKVDEYVELVGAWYPKVAADPKNKVHLVGSFRIEVGDCDTFGRSPCHERVEAHRL